MSRLFYHVMQDNVGNLLFDVSGTMRVAGSGTLATIYGDEALTVILPNPMTNHPSFGSFKCFLGAGDYDFHMAKAGYTFETLTGVQGHGSMAQQDASAVAITGGSVDAVTRVGIGTTAGYPLDVLGLVHIAAGGLGINMTPGAIPLALTYNRALHNGILIVPSDNTGPSAAVVFHNAGSSSIVGTITTTASATAYNTSSDGRLKEAITALPHALETLQQLCPVAFRWKATGEPGHGFIAQEVQAVVPQAVTGDPADPVPTMQMDHSKLIPHLVGAVQDLAQQVQALAARLAGLESQATAR